MMNYRTAFRYLASGVTIALCLGSASYAQEAPPPTVQTEAPVLPTPLADTAPTLPAGLVDPVLNQTNIPQNAAAPAPAESLPHDLSPIGMFRAAHWVVQAVMISLGIACFLTWTVLLFKIIEMLAVNRRLSQSAAVIRSGTALGPVASTLRNRTDPAAFMALAALDELQKSAPVLALAGSSGIKERVRSMLDRVEVQAGKRLRRGTGVLATIGSTAPFVGLFGTVWGIMNAFIRISETKSTNLAVVAPGIAEALLATAMGLVAAIPAVVTYNHFARGIANYRVMLGDAGAGVERLVSRDLDFQAANLVAPALVSPMLAPRKSAQG